MYKSSLVTATPKAISFYTTSMRMSAKTIPIERSPAHYCNTELVEPIPVEGARFTVGDELLSISD